MSEKKYVVPEGMLKAATDAACTVLNQRHEVVIDVALEAALRWLAENPIVPTDDQLSSMWADLEETTVLGYERRKAYICEWQRRMFLAPEPESVVVDEEKERFREALERLAKMGNGDYYGNSVGNQIAQQALGIDRRKPAEPVVPYEVKDLVAGINEAPVLLEVDCEKAIIEAFRRGQQSK